MAKAKKQFILLNNKSNLVLLVVTNADCETLLADTCLTEGHNKEDYTLRELRANDKTTSANLL